MIIIKKMNKLNSLKCLILGHQQESAYVIEDNSTKEVKLSLCKRCLQNIPIGNTPVGFYPLSIGGGYKSSGKRRLG